MNKSVVAIVRYEEPLKSVREAVELSCGLDHLPFRAKVFIKPNIVFWTRAVPFPKWGVITTSRVVEDMVILLKERGIDDITIGEGGVTYKPKDMENQAHAYEALGYNVLNKRYGVKSVNVFERPFEEVDLGGGVKFNFNQDIIHSDFVVNLPVLKTHAQTIISGGIKNLKGTIDIPSRKECHSADPARDLHFMVARLADKMPPMLTLLDGIYTNAMGPNLDGRIRRSNILVASADVLSADLVGARLLGWDPSDVPHLAYAGRNHGRPLDLSDVELIGLPLEDEASFHEYGFPYNEDESLPLPMEKMGVKGLSYPKYDLSLCTYCSGLNWIILAAIAQAWKGQPWDNVEVLTGKVHRATPGKKTILLGKCMSEAHKDDPGFQDMIAIKGCPPQPKGIVKALHRVGINVNPDIIEKMDIFPGNLMKKYKDRPEFDESFFRVD